MALIKCPNCDKDISDKAKSCPHCGHIPVTPAAIDPKPLICEDCGTEIPEGVEVCPNCGCPVQGEDVLPETPQKVEVTAVNLPKGNMKKYIIIALLIVVLATAAVLIGRNIHNNNLAQQEEQSKQEYMDDLQAASAAMLLGAIEAEDAGTLIHDVWYDAIYEERNFTTEDYVYPNGKLVSDFNEALGNLFIDADFISTISSIETNQETVSSLMKSLTNPPEEYEDAYDSIKELYDAYNSLVNLTTSPTGSLSSYTQDFNSADSEFANCYEAIKLYID